MHLVNGVMIGKSSGKQGGGCVRLCCIGDGFQLGSQGVVGIQVKANDVIIGGIGAVKGQQNLCIKGLGSKVLPTATRAFTPCPMGCSREYMRSETKCWISGLWFHR